jgi:hypothetical protein
MFLPCITTSCIFFNVNLGNLAGSAIQMGGDDVTDSNSANA